MALSCLPPQPYPATHSAHKHLLLAGKYLATPGTYWSPPSPDHTREGEIVSVGCTRLGPVKSGSPPGLPAAWPHLSTLDSHAGCRPHAWSTGPSCACRRPHAPLSRLRLQAGRWAGIAAAALGRAQPALGRGPLGSRASPGSAGSALKSRPFPPSMSAKQAANCGPGACTSTESMWGEWTPPCPWLSSPPRPRQEVVGWR